MTIENVLTTEKSFVIQVMPPPFIKTIQYCKIKMKFLTTALLFATISTQQRSVSACPYSDIDNDIPDDATHSHLRRRRLASLTEDETTRANIALIISDKKRFVQGTCFSRAMYEDIYVKLEAIANAIVDSGDRGHFIGGIVRLAAVSPSVYTSIFLRESLNVSETES